MKKDELERLLAWLDPRDRKAALKSLKGYDRPRLTLYHLNALNRREQMRRKEAEQTRKMSVACMALIKMRKKTKTRSVFEAVNEIHLVLIKKLGSFCCQRNLTRTRDEQKNSGSREERSDGRTVLAWPFCDN